jgi:hypothetical protein
MITPKTKQRFIFTGTFLSLFLCLSATKADSADLFKLFLNGKIIVDGKVPLTEKHSYFPSYNGSTPILTAFVKRITIHETDTLEFHVYHTTKRAEMIPILTLRDSSHRDVGGFFNETVDGKMDYYHWPERIRLYGNSLIAWMKARKTKEETFHFYYFEKQYKPITHSVEPNGDHIYESEPDPLGQVLFTMNIAIQ